MKKKIPFLFVINVHLKPVQFSGICFLQNWNSSITGRNSGNSGEVMSCTVRAGASADFTVFTAVLSKFSKQVLTARNR